MGNFGPTEILIVLVILFLLFGSSRLPALSRKAGSHLRSSKDAVAAAKGEFQDGMREIDPVAPIRETMRTPDGASAATRTSQR
jgi:sec-independent protein translocase protein TatA